MDMKFGYHQIEVEENHKERTAFTVGSLGFFEYNKLPMDLTNSPATYQRVMQDILGDLNMKICVIYLDDLIVFNESYEQHIERLNIVLTRLKEANLKLAPEKCFFYKSSLFVMWLVETGLKQILARSKKLLTGPPQPIQTSCDPFLPLQDIIEGS